MQSPFDVKGIRFLAYNSVIKQIYIQLFYLWMRGIRWGLFVGVDSVCEVFMVMLNDALF